MRPLTIITGIVLGSAFSIAFSLAVVMLIFAVIGSDHPQIRSESGSLAASLALFTALTVVAALSFAARLRWHRWQLAGQLLMWAGVLCTGWYYWPD